LKNLQNSAKWLCWEPEGSPHFIQPSAAPCSADDCLKSHQGEENSMPAHAGCDGSRNEGIPQVGTYNQNAKTHFSTNCTIIWNRILAKSRVLQNPPQLSI